MIRSKIFWASIAGLMLFGGGALLLAEPDSPDEAPAPAAAPAYTTTAPARSAKQAVTTTILTTPTVEEIPEAPVRTTPVNDAAADEEVKPTTDREIQPPPAPPLLGIEGGSVYPNTLYVGEKLTFSVAVSGQAASVWVKMVSSSGEIAGTYQLQKSLGGDTGQQWFGSANATEAGIYSVYASATGASGSTPDSFIGRITVSP